MPFVSLPGFRDVYPDALARRRLIFGAWREVAARYGFEEYDGPPLEPLELYTQKSGEEIVGQLYQFEDRGGRRVALRPEMTPTLARMVGARARQLKKPIRWYSMPQLFRYERQQRGRLREHFQLNMDIVGEAGPGADAEVIAAAVDVLRVLGFTEQDVKVRVSDRRIFDFVLKREGVGEGQVPGVLAGLDRLDRSRDAARAAVEQVLGGAAAKAEAVVAAAEALGAGQVPIPAGVTEQLAECEARLDAMGLSGFVVRDVRIVRGLAYYTGLVFEMFDAARTLRAICGGGRYDQLIAGLGGPDLPCVGFGMGDVVLSELLEEKDGASAAGASADVFVVMVSDEDRPAALGLAHALRERGLRVEYALRSQPVRKQLELAAARGARKAVVLGPEERAAGAAVVRSLDTGGESRVPIPELMTTYAL